MLLEPDFMRSYTKMPSCMGFDLALTRMERWARIEAEGEAAA